MKIRNYKIQETGKIENMPCQEYLSTETQVDCKLLFGRKLCGVLGNGRGGVPGRFKAAALIVNGSRVVLGTLQGPEERDLARTPA